jgi:hypothetical protein
VIGSQAFLKDITDYPSGAQALMTGPSLPDIKHASLETASGPPRSRAILA